MKRLSDLEYWALTLPMKTLSLGLTVQLEERGLIADYTTADGAWMFMVTPLGATAVRVYERCVDLEWETA